MKPHLRIALALIWREGKILVTQRRADADHLANFWEFPGGKVGADETAEQATIREALEEVGLAIEVETAREPIIWDYETHVVTLMPFDCRVVSGEPQALEVAQWRWLAPHELDANQFPPANASLLEEIKTSVP